MQKEMDELLHGVEDVVGDRASVPKGDVYPVFEKLGAIQVTLSGEQRIMTMRQRLLDVVDNVVERQRLPPSFKVTDTRPYFIWNNEYHWLHISLP